VASGHDVLRISGVATGTKDENVLEMAQFEKRTLITLDKDFGKLSILEELPALCGIVLFRLHKSSPAELSRIIVDTLNSDLNFVGHFTVVKMGENIRQHPLAGSSAIF